MKGDRRGRLELDRQEEVDVVEPGDHDAPVDRAGLTELGDDVGVGHASRLWGRPGVGGPDRADDEGDDHRDGHETPAPDLTPAGLLGLPSFVTQAVHGAKGIRDGGLNATAYDRVRRAPGRSAAVVTRDNAFGAFQPRDRPQRPQVRAGPSDTTIRRLV